MMEPSSRSSFQRSIEDALPTISPEPAYSPVRLRFAPHKVTRSTIFQRADTASSLLDEPLLWSLMIRELREPFYDPKAAELVGEVARTNLQPIQDRRFPHRTILDAPQLA